MVGALRRRRGHEVPVVLIRRVLGALVWYNAALGHGRRLESSYAVTALALTYLFLFPSVTHDSETFHRMAGLIPYWVLSLPWLVYGLTATYGVLANIHSWRGSREFRMVAAVMGVTIWSWVTLQNYANGSIRNVMVAFSAPAALFSLGILRTAYRGLPRPGFPGAW